MRGVKYLWLLGLILTPAWGQEPPVPPEPAPGPRIEFPKFVQVLPQPKPDPNAVPVLKPGELFLAASDEEFELTVSPPSASITIKSWISKGESTVVGVFAGGGGQTEVRTITKKYVALAQAIPGGTGDAELLGIPYVNAGSKDYVRQLVRLGKAPQPPPDVDPVDPDVDPDVDPVDPQPIPTEQFRVLILYETAAPNTREQLGVINGTKIVDWLKANTAGGKGYRIWDRNITITKDTEWVDILAAAKAAVTKAGSDDPNKPWLIVFRGKEGTAYPLPVPEANAIEFLTKLKGGG